MFARAYLSRSPVVEKFARSIYRQLRVSRAWFGGLVRRLSDPTLPDPDQVFWVDPKIIARHTNYMRSGGSLRPEDRVFNTVEDKGKVYGGDWDISTYKFADLAIYKAIEDRITTQCEWKATEFYQELSENISESSPWGIRSLDDLDRRCEYIDALIESIRNEGFKLAHEIVLDGESRSIKHHRRFGNFVTVNISRSGEFLFQDGRHRLAIAQVLGIAKIPVKVLVRHAEWVSVRREYLALSGRADGNHIDAPDAIEPQHPDLQGN
jgi:hypothetical protein